MWFIPEFRHECDRAEVCKYAPLPSSFFFCEAAIVVKSEAARPWRPERPPPPPGRQNRSSIQTRRSAGSGWSYRGVELRKQRRISSLSMTWLHTSVGEVRNSVAVGILAWYCRERRHWGRFEYRRSVRECCETGPPSRFEKTCQASTPSLRPSWWGTWSWLQRWNIFKCQTVNFLSILSLAQRALAISADHGG